MKKQMIQILIELQLGETTTKEAKSELLSLFGNRSNTCDRCEPNEIDITRCPNCNSSDHRIEKPYRCHDCGTIW